MSSTSCWILSIFMKPQKCTYLTPPLKRVYKGPQTAYSRRKKGLMLDIARDALLFASTTTQYV